MGYANSIAAAIARMGEAQAQGARERGQIYGRMAENLGNIPYQAMAFQQRSNAINADTEHQRLINDRLKRDAEFAKQYQAISGDPNIPDPIKEQQLDNLVRQYHPEKWMEFQQLKQTHVYRIQNELNTVNRQRQGTPGTMNPLAAGMEAQLPMPNRQMQGVGDFQPVVPLEAQRVHPPIMSPAGPLYAETDIQKDQRAEENAFSQARAREQGKAEGKPSNPLREPTPRNITPTELFRQDPSAYETMQDINAKTRAKYRKEPAERGGGGGGASAELKMKQTRLAIKQKKERKLADLNKEHAALAAKGSFMSQEDYDARREQIQREFLEDLDIAGLGTSPGTSAPAAPTPNGTEITASGPNGEKIKLVNGKWVPVK